MQPDPLDEERGEDELAQLLLADALAHQPDMGNQPPDMGEPQVTQPTPQPPVQPQGSTPTAAPEPTPATGAGQPDQTVTDGQDVYNYPAATALAEMTEAQRSEYWRHKARKHEERNKQMGNYEELKARAEQYDALVAASQTEHEKAVAEARRQGAAEATTAANGKLVEAYVRAAAAGRLDDQRVNTLLEGLDRSRFVGANGEVDTDRVTQFVAAFAPPAPTGQPAGTDPASQSPGQQPTLAGPPAAAAPTRVPDLGQGQYQNAPLSGLEAGRAAARARHPRPAQPVA